MNNEDVRVLRVIKTPYDLEDKNVVCYPQLVLYFRIRIFRLFMQPRVVYSAVTVDLVKGEAARSNKFPRSEAIEISEAAVIPALTTHEAAIEEAEKLLLRWLRHKYKIYRIPQMDIVKQREVHKVFFYAQLKNNETVLIDSVKGLEMQ